MTTAELFELARSEVRYARGLVEHVPRMMPGRGFFPGASGYWREDVRAPAPASPRSPVMVLGQDFDTRDNFAAIEPQGREDATSATWRELPAMLSAGGIDPRDCFFTNAYPGLRVSSSNVGPTPGLQSESYVADARRFFALQLHAVQPRLILALGVEVATFLAGCSSVPASWRSKRIITVDVEGDAVVSGALFAPVWGEVCTIALLHHPCFRRSNVRHRRFGTLGGAPAEAALIAHAATIAGVTKAA